MLARRSILSVSLVGAVLLGSVGLSSGANAAPLNGRGLSANVQTELVVQIDHRKKHSRKHRNGWHGGRGWHQELGPRQIRRSLRHRGFHRVRILDRRGPMYIVKARGWRGHPVRLVVDSRSAQIVRSRPMGRRHQWSHNW
ncbi:MAG: hypothetical protein ABJL55_20640 [Roseibium sp.]